MSYAHAWHIFMFILYLTHEEIIDEKCDGQTGLINPINECDRAMFPPCIATCNHGDELRSITIGGQSIRQYCYHVPSHGRGHLPIPVPLIIFLHREGSNTSSVYDETIWRNLSDSYSISGSNGFAVAFPQARRLIHLRTYNESKNQTECATRWDFYHRNFSTGRRCIDCPMGSFSTNADIAFIDVIINDAVDSGLVDPTRIYLSGAAEGGFFAQMYSIARSRNFKSVQPSGTCVAAASVYAAGDPFSNITAYDAKNYGAACSMNPYPSETVPVMITSKDCDNVVGCDSAHQCQISMNGCSARPPGFNIADWINDAKLKMDLDISWDLITTIRNITLRCATEHYCCKSNTKFGCSDAVSAQNHDTFPKSREYRMLSFLEKQTSDSACWDKLD
eukprot:UC4_evm2s1361